MDCKAINSAHLPREFHAPLCSQFDMLEELGRGSTGVVRRARKKADGKEVALKIMCKADTEFQTVVRREYAVLLGIKHPHIIQAVDVFEAERTTVLVLEFFAGQSLQQAVRQAPDRRLAEEAAKELFKMLLQAVDYLHQRRIVHRDIKADNVLVAHDLTNLKLADFNTARQLTEGGALTMTGTRQYMAPETLMGEPPSESNDVWSAGLCLYLMLSGRLPQRQESFASLSEFSSAVAAHPVPLSGEHWSDITGACKDLLRVCLNPNKALRSAPMVLLEHHWFKDSSSTGSVRTPSLKRVRRTGSWPWIFEPTADAASLLP